jgi:HAD superfamily hydrolase (TIGR01509 family)
MRFQALIFDFFGVICSEVAPFWLARHFSASDAIQIKSELVHSADLGLVTQAEMFAGLSLLTGVPPEQIEKEWLLLARIDDRVVSVIKEIQPYFHLALLTNSPSPFVRLLLERNDLARFFEIIVVSSEELCAKPDTAIYTRVLDRLQVAPIFAVMIDDNPLNIEGAAKLGMGTWLFTSSETLQSEIRRLISD